MAVIDRPAAIKATAEICKSLPGIVIGFSQILFIITLPLISPIAGRTVGLIVRWSGKAASMSASDRPA
jgi:hypothetical protein